jgi:hypothetical protein
MTQILRREHFIHRPNKIDLDWYSHFVKQLINLLKNGVNYMYYL